MATIHGSPLSPFVRKTLVLLAEKGVSFDLDPVIPFGVSAEFLKISPLGKIPAYTDGDYAISDSSAICAYLERAHPAPALYPQDAKEYGRALFLEEWADTKLAETLGPPFFQRIVRAKFLKQEADEAAVRTALEATPKIFEWLEAQIGDREFLVGGRFSIADIAVGSLFVNFQLAGEHVDGAKFPKLAAYVERIHSRPSFKPLIEQAVAITR